MATPSNYLFALISAVGTSMTAAAQQQLADGNLAGQQLAIEATDYSNYTFSGSFSFTEHPQSFHSSFMKASSFLRMLHNEHAKVDNAYKAAAASSAQAYKAWQKAADDGDASSAGDWQDYLTAHAKSVGLNNLEVKVSNVSYNCTNPANDAAAIRSMMGGLVAAHLTSCFANSYMSHKVTGKTTLSALASHVASQATHGTPSTLVAAQTLYAEAKTKQQTCAQVAGAGVAQTQASVAQDGDNAQARAQIAQAVTSLLAQMAVG